MTASIFQFISGFGISLLLALFIVNRFSRISRLPPGPRGLPFLGNIINNPTSYEWVHWGTYKDIYGPISSIKLLGQRFIILNDLKTCVDLLEKRSSVYSSRPMLPFAGEMVGWGKQLLLSPYGSGVRTMRKMVHHVIGTKAAIASVYMHKLEHQARLLLARTLEQPQNLEENIRWSQAAMVLEMSHGYTVKSPGPDPLMELVERATREFYIATKPGSWLVDTFPALQHVPSWLPFTSFKRIAAEYRATNMNQVDMPFEFVKQQMQENTAVPSFTSAILQTKPDAVQEEAAKWAAASLFGGGTGTSSATLSTFFLAMMLYPSVQKKAQAEIDSVIGPDRLPTAEDRGTLPYVEALIKEVMRWNTITPLGLPHCSTADDEYNGYFIPKGSAIFANIWKISTDEDNYGDPRTFNPERFQGDNPALDPNEYAFGFGRRSCPGKIFAEAVIFINVALSLSLFDISAPIDPKTGERVLHQPKFISGVLSHPEPFPCEIKPRSENALQLIRSVYEEVEQPPSV